MFDHRNLEKAFKSDAITHRMCPYCFYTTEVGTKCSHCGADIPKDYLDQYKVYPFVHFETVSELPAMTVIARIMMVLLLSLVVAVNGSILISNIKAQSNAIFIMALLTAVPAFFIALLLINTIKIKKKMHDCAKKATSYKARVLWIEQAEYEFRSSEDYSYRNTFRTKLLVDYDKPIVTEIYSAAIPGYKIGDEITINVYNNMIVDTAFNYSNYNS